MSLADRANLPTELTTSQRLLRGWSNRGICMTKTDGVKALVDEVLASGTNWTDDVILEVFLTIERTSAWHRRYAGLCQTLGIDLVNQWSGPR